MAIAVSIILGALTRKSSQNGDPELLARRRERRRIVRDEIRERRRGPQRDDQ
ncbi:MAG TPA: hypothetical protein VFN75_09545 [Pseudonocardiaceae bacterium]|nr:hypothetical protein [Pseudonocardiaceae bacterium]